MTEQLTDLDRYLPSSNECREYDYMNLGFEASLRLELPKILEKHRVDTTRKLLREMRANQRSFVNRSDWCTGYEAGSEDTIRNIEGPFEAELRG